MYEGAIAYEPKMTYNMLLLGETGVGKSTFINAFANYLNFNSLEEAESAENIHSLIPTYFTTTDENFKPKTVYFGQDENESRVPGASATQSARSYVFNVDNISIRLIDTPGIGDTRGINKDEKNFERVLTVIGELKDLHGVCILLKPNNARLTVLFEYCVKQLFSNLQKDASQNIIFLFTNSRSTLYKPGDTLTPLLTILDQIKSKPPNVEIPFSKKNVFCLDNEAFRFLIARKNGIQFTKDEQENFSKSWTISSKVAKDLVNCLKSTKPHKIQDTISLVEARRLILRLSKPLAEITQNIQDNIHRIDRYRENLSDKSKDIDELKKFLKVPTIALNIIKLQYPMTVCTHISCTETYKVQDSSSVHYKQVCHDHCYLSDVQVEVRGDPGLMDCWAMEKDDDTASCRHTTCSHNYRDHMHIYYLTETCDEETEDPNIANKIKKNMVDMRDIEDKIAELTKTQQEYEREIKVIQESMARFAHFLKNNAITPFNDTYKKYIEYLIDREEKLGDAGNKNRIQNFKKLIITYEIHKDVLENELRRAYRGPNGAVTAEEIVNLVHKLYNLPRSGKSIKEAVHAQDQAAQAEILQTKGRVARPVNVKGESSKYWLTKLSSYFSKAM